MNSNILRIVALLVVLSGTHSLQSSRRRQRAVSQDWTAFLEGMEHACRCVQEGSTDAQEYLSRTIKKLKPLYDGLYSRRAGLESEVIDAEREAAEYAQLKGFLEKPEISIFIPVHNRPAVVRTAIESVLNQNFSVPYELIIVDDCSSDSTWDVVQEYEQKYAHVFAYRHTTNRKAPAARNTAIAHARGKYVFNLDSDDILLEGSVQKLYEALEATGLEVGYFGEYRYFKHPDIDNAITHDRSRGNHRGTVYTVAEAARTTQLLPSCGCRLYTKSSWLYVGGYIEAPGHDTWAFSYLQLAAGFKAYVLDEVGYLHRVWDWNRQDCYTHTDVVKEWDTSPRIAILAVPEILRRATIAQIKSLPPQNGALFIDYVGRSGIPLLASEQLDRVQQAQIARYRNDQQTVLQVLSAAALVGTTNEFVLFYLLEASVELGATQVQLKALSMLKRLSATKNLLETKDIFSIVSKFEQRSID